MVVVRVLFPIQGLEMDDFNKKMMSSVPKYEGLNGLIRKYYVVADDKSQAGGIYLWETRDIAESWYNPEWIAYMTEVFGEAPMLEYLDCTIVVDNETQNVTSKIAA